MLYCIFFQQFLIALGIFQELNVYFFIGLMIYNYAHLFNPSNL